MTLLLEDSQIRERLRKIEGWERVGGEIQKKFRLQNFREALQFVNQVGEIAESIDHHPDILIHNYKFVTLKITTHSAGGLTRIDFDLAGRVETAFGPFRK